MVSDLADTGVVILAGGHARRFGRDKARAHWRGRTMLEHVLEAVPSQCRPNAVLVIRAEQDDAVWPLGTIEHDDPGLPEGPLRGMVLGLERTKAPWSWVLACDLPLVRTELLQALRAAARDEVAAVVPRWEGRLHPLCALYSRRCVPQLRRALEGGTVSPTQALASMPVRILEEEVCRGLDPSGLSFANVNDPSVLVDLDGDASRVWPTDREE